MKPRVKVIKQRRNIRGKMNWSGTLQILKAEKELRKRRCPRIRILTSNRKWMSVPLVKRPVQIKQRATFTQHTSTSKPQVSKLKRKSHHYGHVTHVELRNAGHQSLLVLLHHGGDPSEDVLVLLRQDTAKKKPKIYTGARWMIDAVTIMHAAWKNDW